MITPDVIQSNNTPRPVEDDIRYLSEPVKLEKEKGQLDDLEDGKVWQLFQEGVETAFIYIYKKHFDALFSYGSQFSNNEALVEDAIQDMFVELREKRGNSVIRSSIKNYLFTCLRRRIVHYKNQLNKITESFESFAHQTFQMEVSVEQRIIEGQIKEDQKKKLENSLKLLTERQREALYYLYHEGMSYDEIKELMNFSNIRSTRNLIYRALNTIKSSILLVILYIMLGSQI